MYIEIENCIYGLHFYIIMFLAPKCTIFMEIYNSNINILTFGISSDLEKELITF